MNNDINLWEIIVAKFEKLEEQLEKLSDKQEEMNKVLSKQEASLTEHMRRTDLLERKMEPLEKHIQIFNAGLKIVGGLTVLVTMVGGIIKIIQAVTH